MDWKLAQSLSNFLNFFPAITVPFHVSATLRLNDMRQSFVNTIRNFTTNSLGIRQDSSPYVFIIALCTSAVMSNDSPGCIPCDHVFTKAGERLLESSKVSDALRKIRNDIWANSVIHIVFSSVICLFIVCKKSDVILTCGIEPYPVAPSRCGQRLRSRTPWLINKLAGDPDLRCLL